MFTGSGIGRTPDGRIYIFFTDAPNMEEAALARESEIAWAEYQHWEDSCRQTKETLRNLDKFDRKEYLINLGRNINRISIETGLRRRI